MNSHIFLPILLLLLSPTAHSTTSRSRPPTFFHFLAIRAVASLNAEWADRRHWNLRRFISATSPQMDEATGTLTTRIKVEIVRTECLKEADNSRVVMDLCPVDENAPKMECTFDVLTRPQGSAEFIRRGCDRIEPVPQKPGEEERAHVLGNDVEEGEGVQSTTPSTQSLLDSVEPVVKAKERELWAKFRQFVDNQNRTYSTKREVLKRFKQYRANLLLAQKWQDAEQGTAEYGETPFSDLSIAEFHQIYLPFEWPLDKLSAKRAELLQANDPLPDSWDWREKNAVTGVKNQGACGSCWAFSVTGNIEGQWALKTGKLQALSEQELLDCDKLDLACNGGLPLQAYKEIIRIGGLEPEGEYPYDAHREQCHLNRSEIAVYINDSIQLAKDEVQMAQWLVKNGPISIGVNALPLQFYRHGISHPPRFLCSPSMLNHGVLIVGFGKEGNKPFWIIKNSWGQHWGESGYYRLYRGDNVCGVHEMATSAVIE